MSFATFSVLLTQNRKAESFPGILTYAKMASGLYLAAVGLEYRQKMHKHIVSSL